ncbi:MAG TPA: sigma 54-interacting transcriptional regulator [Tissierellia bacterium]|nr:sigma 54-interacting transcriptional regulator [Tissierellia bacterium]
MKLIDERSKELETILDSIKDAVCIVNADGITKYWNKGAEKLYGISKEEILNKPITDFFPSSLLHRILKEERAYEDIYNSPKENCYNISSASPLYFNGKLVGGISIDRDITDHIKTTELLNKTKSNLKVLKEELSAINKARSPFSNILGNNPKFREAINLAKDMAHSDINILIKGESGTGKELFARAIHMASGREGYFVPINCSAIPNELIESELFGYAGGAFTGALKEGRIGKIELANNGTLFLDEIGDMPLNMQPKILRVLEDGEITPIGSEKSIKVDIRVIAASNKDLERMVESGTFRKDLYYRLNSVIIEIPPLRDRKDDIPFLANRFVQDYCMEYGVNILKFSNEVMEAFMEHDWEGNVRELKNIIERMVILARNNKSNVIDINLLPDNMLKNRIDKIRKRKNTYDLNAVVQETERKTILDALQRTGYNKLKAAKLLNIPRSTLYFKMKKYHIEEVPKC